MTSPYRIAHFTDPHLPLLAEETRVFATGLNKRLSGMLSWRHNRRHIHLPEILARLVGDIHMHHPQHIALTGDLVNISLPQEFSRAAAWLRQLGAPGNVSLVPGNHDAYAADPAQPGLDLWADYMRGDDQTGGANFPYCRVRDGIALIGVTTAVPTRIFSATGAVGSVQLARLGEMLAQRGKQGLMRIVMIHHPPGAAGASKRKGLIDRAALLKVFARHGAELILHGHTHRGVFDHVPGPNGPIPVLAPASASARDPYGEHARWHMLEISSTSSGQWRILVTVRGYEPASKQFRTDGQFSLSVQPVNADRPGGARIDQP